MNELTHLHSLKFNKIRAYRSYSMQLLLNLSNVPPITRYWCGISPPEIFKAINGNNPSRNAKREKFWRSQEVFSFQFHLTMMKTGREVRKRNFIPNTDVHSVGDSPQFDVNERKSQDEIVVYETKMCPVRSVNRLDWCKQCDRR